MNPRLAARRRHIKRIRKAIAAGTLAAFVALFSVVYIQMAVGRDPALGASVQQTAITASVDTASVEVTTPAPVTTSQS